MTADGRSALREMLNGAALRAIAGVRDVGELALARIERADGGDHVDTQGDADVWVHVVDVLSGMPVVGRLFVPGNVLFAAADLAEGDSVMVATPRDARGPGVPYVLHGDAGTAARVPSWLRTAVGIFTRKALRLESSAEDVVVECPASKRVKLGAAAAKKVNREGDAVDCGTLAFTFTPGMAATLSITYTPPAGMGAPVTLTSGSGEIALKGKTGPGSTKVLAED